MTNSKEIEAKITNYGAIVVSLRVPDKKGKFDDVVLGYVTLDGYLNDKTYFGGIVGRYANRIAKDRFSLNGKEYKLAVNNGENHLHGCIKHFETDGLEGEIFRIQRRRESGIKLFQQGRRRRLSGKFEGKSRLHFNRKQRVEN